MEGQSKKFSLIEAISNIGIGYGVAIFTQIMVFPLFDIHIDIKSNLYIGLIFTVISIIRSYSVRRLFNWFHNRPIKPDEIWRSCYHRPKRGLRVKGARYIYIYI